MRLKTVICVPTYQRAVQLATLLRTMAVQIGAAGPRHKVRLLVLDNDPDGTAEETVQVFAREHSQLDVRYRPVKDRGIGHVRNVGFELVEADEWLIFFDDDQIPSATWLVTFLQSRVAPGVNVIFGPVTPCFVDALPEWGTGGWAWGVGRAFLEDGRRYRTAGFGNVMFSSDVLKSPLCRVPDVFAAGPGEDTAVSLALSKAGFEVVYRAQAAAEELVDGTRLTVEWVLARAKADGMTWGRLASIGREPWWRVHLYALKAVLEALPMLVHSGLGRSNGTSLRIKAKCRFAFAAGVWAHRPKTLFMAR